MYVYEFFEFIETKKRQFTKRDIFEELYEFFSCTRNLISLPVSCDWDGKLLWSFNGL